MLKNYTTRIRSINRTPGTIHSTVIRKIIQSPRCSKFQSLSRSPQSSSLLNKNFSAISPRFQRHKLYSRKLKSPDKILSHSTLLHTLPLTGLTIRRMSAEKNFTDFSFATNYATFRPDYPQELYEKFTSHLKHSSKCIDIGCGTGQATFELCKYSENVEGWDPSPGQIKQANEQKELKELNIQRAVQFVQHADSDLSQVAEKSISLITVAQAMHWLDLKTFFPQVNRTLAPDGLFCYWGYSLCSVEQNSGANDLFQELYKTTRKYWAPDRDHVDEGYARINSEAEQHFSSISRLSLVSKKQVSVEHMIGYINTWSGLQAYRKENPDPLPEFKEKLCKLVTANQELTLAFPIFLTVCYPRELK